MNFSIRCRDFENYLNLRMNIFIVSTKLSKLCIRKSNVADLEDLFLFLSENIISAVSCASLYDSRVTLCGRRQSPVRGIASLTKSTTRPAQIITATFHVSYPLLATPRFPISMKFLTCAWVIGNLYVSPCVMCNFKRYCYNINKSCFRNPF